jgi:hypothetical protein
MKRCARLLGISWVQMVGHLQYLWWWALDFATEGDVSEYDAHDFADAALWEGDVEAFYRALLDCGFIEETDGGTRLHDWQDYAGKLLEGREKAAERQRRWRDNHRNGNEPATGDASNRKQQSRNGNVTVMSPSGNALTTTVTVTETPYSPPAGNPAFGDAEEAPAQPAPELDEYGRPVVYGARGIRIRRNEAGYQNLGDLMANDPPKANSRGPAPPDPG